VVLVDELRVTSLFECLNNNLTIQQLNNSSIMNFIIKILISAAIAFALSKILSGVHIDSIMTALIFAVVLAAMDAIVKPILVVLTLPVTIVTLGLFLFAINAIVILLAAKLIDGIKIDGFWWAMLFSIILSIFDTGVQKSMDKSKS
jgi:putative membrane protein